MSDDDQTGNNKDDVTVAEMEERLEACLMERVMKKVNEHLVGASNPRLRRKSQRKVSGQGDSMGVSPSRLH